MAETSFFWGGTLSGDASLAPYSDDQFSDFLTALFVADRADQGVVSHYGNKLAVSNATSPVVVSTGAAIVDGKLYINDAALSVTIPTPSGASRYDRLVLRKDFSAQTVRVTRIAGVEGGGIPSLVQTDGTTWDIPLATLLITTGGAITITDNRVFWSAGSGADFTELNIPSAKPMLSGIASAALEYVEYTGAGTVKPATHQLRYDPSTDEGRIWEFVAQQDASVPSVVIKFKMASANSAKNAIMVAQACVIKHGDTSVSAKAFGSANSLTFTVPANADEEDEQTIPLTNGGAMSKGDRIILAVWHDGGNHTGDLILTGLKVTYA